MYDNIDDIRPCSIVSRFELVANLDLVTKAPSLIHSNNTRLYHLSLVRLERLEPKGLASILTGVAKPQRPLLGGPYRKS